MTLLHIESFFIEARLKERNCFTDAIMIRMHSADIVHYHYLEKKTSNSQLPLQETKTQQFNGDKQHVVLQ